MLIRTQVSLDPQAYREAKAEAKRQGISLAEFLRRAVATMLGTPKTSSRPWMRHAGTLASGDPDASRNIDAVVYGRARP